MKIFSVIGTRPQYIKIKPFYDFCYDNNINHKIIDTLQHYSYNVSESLIDDLDLEIDFTTKVDNKNEISFISNTMLEIEKILNKEKPNIILTYGDTNSTLCASLVAYKLNIPVAHIEAGLRCGTKEVPEEVNRILADTVSDLKFCSSKTAVSNLNDGIYCGDLEYELLNHINPTIKFDDYGVMTLHRQSNTNLERLKTIMKFCKNVPHEIRFFAHHRTLPLLSELEIPKNVIIFESCPYTEMIKNLSNCRFIITDSGGIQKTAPFFGKRALVLRENIEWVETERRDFTKRADLTDLDLKWLLSLPPERKKRFYLHSKQNCSDIIYQSIKRYLDDSII